MEKVPIAKARREAREKAYNPEKLVARLKELMQKHNQSYRETALACRLDHQGVRRILNGHRPNITACILLANHFGINPNEFLELAGFPKLDAFDIKTASAENLPPEAVDVAIRLSQIREPGTRKQVAEAILVLLQKYFEK
jgi:transcriptional regulator with XRE-family HTH domain